MVANTDKGRMISLCGSGIDVFEQRSADEQTTVLDALQRFKDGSKAVPSEPLVLDIQSLLTLPERADNFDPKEFFKTRKGFYVWDGFRDRILPVVQEVKSLPAREIASFSLAKSATDAEIRNELPEGHIFQDASAFCAYLSGLIDQQKNGEKGDLLNNGCANIFYVVGLNGRVFTVRVRWFSGSRGWLVRACRPDDSQWDAGDRAFSATAPWTLCAFDL